MRMVRAVMCVTLMILVALGSLTVEARHEVHPLFDLMSREEMVDLAGYGEEKLSTVLVIGSLLCQDHESSTSSTPQPVSGAVVGVTCHSSHGKKNKSNWEETRTDEFGDFTIDLPSHLHADRNLDKACQFKVVRLSRQSPCSANFTRREQHKGIKLLSARDGVRTYSTGKITL